MERKNLLLQGFSGRMHFFICLLQALYWTIESPAGGNILLIHIHFEIYLSKTCWIYFDFYNLWSKNTCIIWKYMNILWKLLFYHHRTNFNRIFMVLGIEFQLWMFSNERLPMTRAFCRSGYRLTALIRAVFELRSSDMTTL